MLALRLGPLVLHYAFRGGYSSTSGNCGAFFVAVTTASSYATWAVGAHYAIRGGDSSLGDGSGSFCVRVSKATNTTAWHYGAYYS